MALLDGFKVIPLQEKVEDTYLTITNNSLKFNRASARTLGLPGRILLLTNDKRIQIAITPAKPDDEDGVDFSFEEGSREKSICVKEPMIIKNIKKLIGTEEKGRNLEFKIKGVAYPEEKVIIFDMGEAVATPVKTRGRRSTKNQ